ncbi:MAG: glycosyltransferase family 2 protein [Bradyrhizobium icense]|nr:MAG: glycosyltransferase family 2 protein [Bradyrhizobium icense]
MSAPRVTVIIATYNRSRVLPFAINSVLGQTLQDFELLVVGDGCTDDSEQVVGSIKDPRVRWINLPSNTGHQSGPNNRGLQEARGEYIAYLGHDDIWLRHHLERTIGILAATGADISHSLLVLVPPGAEVGLPFLPKPQLGHGGPPSCRVHRRRVAEKIGGWRDYRSISLAPETDYFMRACEAGFGDVFVPHLTVIKFPALLRKNVYLDQSDREQAEWTRRISSEADFETAHLVRMIEAIARDLPHEMPIRRLIGTFFHEIAKRAKARLLRTRRGAQIAHARKYKGL